MHVAIVDTTMTQESVGGAQSFLVDLCCGLVSRGWKASVLTNAGPNASVVEALRSAGAAVEKEIWRAWELPESRAQALASWVATEQPSSYVVSISPDVGWLALPFISRDVVTVSIAHNDVEAFYAPLRHYIHFVDCAVGVSHEIHRRIVADCGVLPGRARHIPYGVRSLTPGQAAVRISRRPPGSPLRIGYVGRLEQDQKRVLDFVPLLAALKRRAVDFTFDVVGEGSHRGRLAQGLEALPLTRRPRFWGWLDGSAVRERLAELDILVLLSGVEGLPVALLEAMAQAVVPVVTRISSGCPDLVRDGVNGFLAPVGNSEAFAERLHWLWSNEGALRQMKRSAWEAARDFSLDRMVGSYASLLDTPGSWVGARAPKPSGYYPIMPSCRSSYPLWLRTLKARLTAPRFGR
jgi:glycosyltransferase involved in cell wall biosynthesis